VYNGLVPTSPNTMPSVWRTRTMPLQEPNPCRKEFKKSTSVSVHNHRNYKLFGSTTPPPLSLLLWYIRFVSQAYDLFSLHRMQLPSYPLSGIK